MGGQRGRRYACTATAYALKPALIISRHVTCTLPIEDVAANRPPTRVSNLCVFDQFQKEDRHIENYCHFKDKGRWNALCILSSTAHGQASYGSPTPRTNGILVLRAARLYIELSASPIRVHR